MSSEERGDVVDGRLCLHLGFELELWLEKLAVELFSGEVEVQSVMQTQLIYELLKPYI